MDFLEALTRTLSRHIPDLPRSHLLVAYSGGMDSTVLLDAVCRLRDAGAVGSVSALHVHHGLSGYADDWAVHCQRFCQERSIPLLTEYVSLPENCRDGVELAARNARYDIFEAAVEENQYLLQAHHQRDQAETFLFRALRGSGIDGLSGIPVTRPLAQGYILRPLLNTPWQKLKTQAEQWQLEWVEDNTNTDTRFDRNFLRQEILPLLESRWPEAQKKLAEGARACEEAKESLNSQVAEDFNYANVPAAGLFLENAVVLDCQHLSSLPETRQRRVLRYWLGLHKLKMPSRVVLERILTEVIPARQDAEPEVLWSDGCVRRYQGQLIAVSSRPLKVPGIQKHWNIKNDRRFELPENGFLFFDGDTTGFPEGTVFSVSYRREQENLQKFSLVGRRGSKTLKRWLQEFSVPPWLREQVPLIMKDGELVAIPGLGVVQMASIPDYGQPLAFRQNYEKVLEIVVWTSSHCKR